MCHGSCLRPGFLGVLEEKIGDCPFCGFASECHSHDGWEPKSNCAEQICRCIAMWSKQRWPPRYKRHNFCDWDRMAWAPELQPRPKWFQMIAISRQRAQTESAAYLYTKCYETIPILPQICHFMRLALLNWGAQKLCPFSNTFFHFRPRKGFLF